MPRQRSRLERRFSRTAAVALLLLTSYVLGGPMIHTAATQLLPRQRVTHFVYAPLLAYARGKTRLAGADWYLSYWFMCERWVRKHV